MTADRMLNRLKWLGALALVLALVGHDVLMVALTVAPPAAAMAKAAHGQGSPHGLNVANGQLADMPSEPGHLKDCGTTGEAVPRAAKQFAGNGVATATIVTHANHLALVPSLTDGWSEPFWPPGTRRALIQVFRM